MNKKGDIFTILTKKEVVIFAIIVLLFAVGIPIYNNIKQSYFQNNQKQVIDELKTNMNTLTGTLESTKNSILILNDNIGKIDNKVSSLDQNVIKVNQKIDKLEETVKTIEPTSVQNTDISNLTTIFNIFNFRLIINFFIALSLSLFSIELIKIFGDFISFTKYSQNHTWNKNTWKKYWEYRNHKKTVEIKVFQEYIKLNTQKVENETTK